MGWKDFQCENCGCTTDIYLSDRNDKTTIQVVIIIDTKGQVWFTQDFSLAAPKLKAGDIVQVVEMDKEFYNNLPVNENFMGDNS